MGWKDTIKEEKPKSKKSSWRDTIQEDTSVKSDGSVLETIGDVLTTAPQGVTSWEDEITSAAKAIIQQGGGSRASFSELYEPALESRRQSIAESRERSPIATTAGEIGAGIASSFIPVAGLGKLSSAGALVGRSALEGLGTAEDKMSWEGATQAGIGGALGAGGALVSGGLKKLHAINPKAERAGVLGAKSAEFKEIGIKEREKIADKLHKKGLFSKQKVSFDPDTLQWKNQGKTLETLEKPVREVLSKRLQDAVDVIQEKKMEILGEAAETPVDITALDSALEIAANKYSKEGTNISKRLSDADEIRGIIIDDIIQQGDGIKMPTIADLEAAKKRLSSEVGKYGKAYLGGPDIAEKQEIYNLMYSEVNKKLRELIPNKKYTEFNNAQQEMLTAMADLHKAMATDNAKREAFGWGSMVNKLGNMIQGSEESALGWAGAKEISDLPVLKQSASGLRSLVPELPGAAIRQLDPSMPEVTIPFRPEPKKDNFNKGTMINPRDIIKFQIPRTTEGILQNKELVIAKLYQNNVPEEMIQTIAMGLDEDHEAISQVAPLIMTQMPTLFERSKYKVFDGKIVDAADRARINDAIARRKDLDSITRAKAINAVNLDGTYPEGLV